MCRSTTQGVHLLYGPSGVAGGNLAQTGFGRVWIEVQSEPHPGQRIVGGVVPTRRLSPACRTRRARRVPVARTHPSSTQPREEV